MRVEFIREEKIKHDNYFLYQAGGFELAVKNPGFDTSDEQWELSCDGIYHTASLPTYGLDNLVSFSEEEGGDEYDNIVEAVRKDALKTLIEMCS